MSTVMLKLPMTSVLLATLLLTADGLTVMPLVIVAVVVAYVTAARLEPAPPARHIAPSTVPTATGTHRRSNPAKRYPLPLATTEIGNSARTARVSATRRHADVAVVDLRSAGVDQRRTFRCWTDVPDVVLLHGEFGGLAESGVKWTGAVRGGG